MTTTVPTCARKMAAKLRASAAKSKQGPVGSRAFQGCNGGDLVPLSYVLRLHQHKRSGCRELAPPAQPLTAAGEVVLGRGASVRDGNLKEPASGSWCGAEGEPPKSRTCPDNIACKRQMFGPDNRARPQPCGTKGAYSRGAQDEVASAINDHALAHAVEAPLHDVHVVR